MTLGTLGGVGEHRLEGAVRREAREEAEAGYTAPADPSGVSLAGAPALQSADQLVALGAELFARQHAGIPEGR